MAKKKKNKIEIPEFQNKKWIEAKEDLFDFIDKFNKPKNEKEVISNI
jgi:hypothetical protein